MFFNFDQKLRCAGQALRGSWPVVAGWAKVLPGILLLFLIQDPLRASQSVMLGWQPSSDPNAVGYRIYYGTSSHNYSGTISLGKLTSVTIDGLTNGATYYFAATTFNAQDQESGFSNEASYQVPAVTVTNAAPTVQIQRETTGQFTLTVSGTAGQTLAIEATQDFNVWMAIGMTTVGTNGVASFTDNNAMNFPQRFYRTETF
jgi:fibronectin type 3 domain-containing protein